MQIIIYLILVLMIVRMFLMSKRTNKSKKLIDVVNSVGDKEEFFENMKQFEEEMKDDNEFEEFDEVMNSIDVDRMMTHEKDGSVKITENEDAFFYLYLGIPNILEKDGKPDYRRKLNEKMDQYKDILKNQLVRVEAEAINQFYEKEGDQGLAFYESLLAGDYSQYQYSKSLIGLYKSIANATAAVIYKENDQTEKYEECKPMLENFAKSGIGERWMKQLGLEVSAPVEEEEFDNIEEKEEDQ